MVMNFCCATAGVLNAPPAIVAAASATATARLGVRKDLMANLLDETGNPRTRRRMGQKIL
jgi:hypothetical protein